MAQLPVATRARDAGPRNWAFCFQHTHHVAHSLLAKKKRASYLNRQAVAPAPPRKWRRCAAAAAWASGVSSWRSRWCFCGALPTSGAAADASFPTLEQPAARSAGGDVESGYCCPLQGARCRFHDPTASHGMKCCQFCACPTAESTPAQGFRL